LTRSNDVKVLEVEGNKDEPLTVVELYKMDDQDYVLDDHHRIAAVQEEG